MDYMNIEWHHDIELWQAYHLKCQSSYHDDPDDVIR